MDYENIADQRTPEMKREDYLKKRIKDLERDLDTANVTINCLRQQAVPKRSPLDDFFSLLN